MRFNVTFLSAASCLAIGIALPTTAAHAQSTGSVEFEDDIIVTGTAYRDIAGIELPATSKAKQVLTAEHIQRQIPGQTILDTINIVPGVNFTNNDAYGSAGGQLSIRGFSQDRISLTFDGIPLNDSGNYAIYSSQMLDAELIEQVNVNLGTTDVDSPTAAATGSTVNFRTRDPFEDFGATMSGSFGEDSFFRMFGVVDTGAFGPFGTRAFFSASHSENDNPYNNYGRIRKDQFNAKVYQPIGGNGDFISIGGHYNNARNNFFGSMPLRLDASRKVGSGSGDRFPLPGEDRSYNINYPCTIDVAEPGVADTTNSCGTEFDRRYNPAQTGNIRIASRFTLAENLTLTIDPSFQYVRANGGGTVTGREGLRTVAGQDMAGFIGGSYYFGRDLNGDGDVLDSVTLMAPSETNTRRLGLITGLRWEFNENHAVRINYTFDRARHRQTGEVGRVLANGEPDNVFPELDPLVDVNGVVVQKRDRKSYAILHQVSGEYRGEFFEALTVTAGIRAPFFKRDLNNFCFTTSDTGFVDCFGKDNPLNAAYAAANPALQGPQQRVLKYDKILPNLGGVFKVTPDVSVFANYSKGLQVPGTDSLYNAFFFAPDTASARPQPETTDNFDLGLRLRSGTMLAQLTGWYTKYKNRLASAYDPETERNLYRNLGTVDKYGIDGSISWQPIREISLNVFGSWMKSKILDDVQAGTCSSAQVGVIAGCAAAGDPLFVATKGKRESGAPEYSYGGQARGTFGPFELGVIAKRTGGRFVYDTNLPIYAGTATAPVAVYSGKTNPYWLVNLDARMNLSAVGLSDRSYLQLNVYNLFNELYVGNFTNGLQQGGVIGSGIYTGSFGSAPNAQVGAPRTISGTIVFGF